jgi:hypothetical protein
MFAFKIQKRSIEPRGSRSRPMVAKAVTDGLREIYGPLGDQPLPGYFGKPLGRLYFSLSGFVARGTVAQFDEPGAAALRADVSTQDHQDEDQDQES